MVDNDMNGISYTARASDLQHAFNKIIPELVKFIQDADTERRSHQVGNFDGSSSLTRNASSSSRLLLEQELQNMLKCSEKGSGVQGMQTLAKVILENSVNTSAPGFLDKLYAAPLPPGIVAECLLGVLNTNLHVYQVAPALTLIEKQVTRDLAAVFAMEGPRTGGISVQGGSASNLTSIVVARNTLFPETKTKGNHAAGQLLLFTSAHGHYSVEKAAQALGFGSESVVLVPVDAEGCMNSNALSDLIQDAKREGKVPFYINATAGTTVLGSFDPFEKIAEVAREHRLWLHVDAAWGGGFAFSSQGRLRKKLCGIGLADSIATNPHKMLGVPMTCSFLLGKDMRQFQQANTLKAAYLFHEEADDEMSESRMMVNGQENGLQHESDAWNEPYDLADLTLQCGRRGDSLKLFLSWKYYGTSGYAKMVDNAYNIAVYLSHIVQQHPDLTLVLADPVPSCLQVCFYYTPCGKLSHELTKSIEESNDNSQANGVLRGKLSTERLRIGKLNTGLTAKIAKALIPKGFMIDFAPALEGQEEKGSFFRVVTNISTVRETVERLIQELVQVGDSIISKTQPCQ